MGFDIHGINPDNETGSYFRNNVWWWRPLADFVLDFVDIPSDKKKFWHSNDGQEVTEATAHKIADFIDEVMANMGKYAAYVTITQEKREQAVRQQFPDLYKDDESIAYPFSFENLKEFGKFCRHSGGFEIW